MKLFSYTVDKSCRQEMLKSTYINILHCTVHNDNDNDNDTNNDNDNDDNDNDKETNIWTLFEGTVCQVDNNPERFEEKQTKYIELCAGIKREYKTIDVYQINIIYCF